MTILHAVMTLPFAALLLAAALYGLALSGHFPREHRGATLRGAGGTALMTLTTLTVAAAVVCGATLAWSGLPFAILIIAGGVGVLVAPLILTRFPDPFVNGRSALIVFTLAAVVCAAVLYVTIG